MVATRQSPLLARAPRLVRALWLGASMLVAVGGVWLKVNHRPLDSSVYLSELAEVGIRAFYVCIVISGLCGIVGAFCGRTWRAPAFGLAAPMAPVFCGAIFALFLSVIHRYSSPSYFEQMTRNEPAITPCAVGFLAPINAGPAPINPGPQRFNGSP